MRFRLVRYFTYRKGTIYSILFEGETETEFSRFLNDPAISSHGDFEILMARIKRMAHTTGFLKENFKKVSPGTRAVYELRGTAFEGLRVFCFLAGEQLVVFGNGGRKSTKRISENALHQAYVDLMLGFESEFMRRMRDRSISIIESPEGCLITGDLEFEVTI